MKTEICRGGSLRRLTSGVLATLLSLALALAGVSAASAQAFADEAQGAGASALRALSSSSVTASGECGTVTWTLYGDGELVLAPTSGSTGTLESFDGWYVPWEEYTNLIVSVTVDGTVVCGESVNSMFAYCSSLETLNLSGLDTSNVTDMDGMFYRCSSLESLDLSSFDTSNVTDMGAMFGQCSSLTSLDVSSFDTSNVTDMYSMFYGCESLESLDLSFFDTSSVEYMDFMFSGCESLESLDLSSFDTSSVVAMTEMFCYCSSLESLDVSSFDTSSVEYMPAMFCGCSSLESLDLSSFDTSSVEYMYGLFVGCTSLDTVYVSELWSTDSVVGEACYKGGYAEYVYEESGYDSYYESIYGSTDNLESDSDYESYYASYYDLLMFYGCTSLVGGNGTAYDDDHVGIEYARIDTDDEPGYFTDIADYGAYKALYGANRYATMRAIVEEAFGETGSDYAVVATGTNYPDALAAASLAGALDAPVVLISPKTADDAAELLEELGVSSAYVVGGTSAVSAAEVAAIEAAGVSVQRVYGANRYATALAIAEEVAAVTSSEGAASDTCLVATGAAFADALSASPYAYWSGSPIYLAGKDGSVSADALAAIEEAGYERIVVMGGTSAVSVSGYKALAATGAEVERVNGANRYDTSAAMAQWSVAQGMSYDGAAVATGAAYPDALAGAALCGRAGSVLLLASDSRLQTVELLGQNAAAVTTVYILGGTNAVSATVRAAVKALL